MGTLVSKEELREHALSFLKKQEYMVIGTSLHDHVWSATVKFVVTDSFELIFYSRPDTLHSQNIEQNPHVSAVITEMPVKKSGSRSIQLAGMARIADGVEWNTYYPLYKKKVKNADSLQDYIVYVIKPEDVWMIDDKLWGIKARVQVNIEQES